MSTRRHRKSEFTNELWLKAQANARGKANSTQNKIEKRDAQRAERRAVEEAKTVKEKKKKKERVGFPHNISHGGSLTPQRITPPPQQAVREQEAIEIPSDSSNSEGGYTDVPVMNGCDGVHGLEKHPAGARSGICTRIGNVRHQKPVAYNYVNGVSAKRRLSPSQHSAASPTRLTTRVGIVEPAKETPDLELMTHTKEHPKSNGAGAKLRKPGVKKIAAAERFRKARFYCLA
jgi:hypothetical protein